MVMNVSGALAAYRQTMKQAATGVADASTDSLGVGGVGGFADTLKNFMGDTVKQVRDAENLATQGATGKASVQDVVLAVSKAEVDFSTLIALRDKFVSAYQEIMRTSV